MKLYIGTRKSRLALAQTELVRRALHTQFPEIQTEVTSITTKGDRISDVPLSSFGSKGIFITEIEQALLNGTIDLAVHSAKDLPTELAQGLTVPAVLKRGDPADVLVLRHGEMLRNAADFRIGTGSLRRRMFLHGLYPEVQLAEIRGNVDTRLHKLREGQYDGIVLAAAGLERLHTGMEGLHCIPFSPVSFLPAPCQAIIAVECRTDDRILPILQKINDTDTYAAFRTERFLLAGIGGGMQLPSGRLCKGTGRADRPVCCRPAGSYPARQRQHGRMARNDRKDDKTAMKQGKVCLIGAGCGTADLITLRGKELLAACEVVLYDDLIDERLLQFVPEDAEKIYIGKRGGRHSTSQEHIHALLTEKAAEGKLVARLKGGDPFVFGRGGGEVLALQAHGIPFEIVPGVTSAVAVPELAGIPVTHRSVSRSFHVITGHTREDLLPADMALYAQFSGTLVFLMGLSNLRQIAHLLMEHGRSPVTPAAVISNGCTPAQNTVRGTLGDIAELTEHAGICTPAVLVVGETASMQLLAGTQSPLAGVSVTVTGTQCFSDRLAVKLEHYGADVHRACILRRLPYDTPALRQVFAELTQYTMLVLTSPNGAELFFQHLQSCGIDHRSLHGIRFAVIGNATAAVLQAHGFYADILPERFTSDALGKEIVRHAGDGEHLLLLRAEQASPVLTDMLHAHHIPFREVKLYDIRRRRDELPQEIRTDYLVFASRSGVREFHSGGNTIAPETKIICIGGATAGETETLYGREVLLPVLQHTDSIVELILKKEGISL